MHICLVGKWKSSPYKPVHDSPEDDIGISLDGPSLANIIAKEQEKSKKKGEVASSDKNLVKKSLAAKGKTSTSQVGKKTEAPKSGKLLGNNVDVANKMV